MRAAATILFAALTASPGIAQQWDCGSDALPQQGINYCLFQDFQAADTELNAVYQAARQNSSPALFERVRAAQLAWIPFRDAACEAEAAFMEGGSGEAMLRYACLAQLTEVRTEELRVFAEVN